MDKQKTDQMLPGNTYAERLVLGSAMLQGGNMELLAGSLEVPDFALEKHKTIFAAMLDVYLSGARVDRVTTAERLIAMGRLENVDGLSYLSSLDEGLPEIYHLESYIEIIREKSALRKAIYAAQALMEQAFRADTPAATLVGTFTERLTQAINNQIGSPLPSAEQIIMDYPGGINAFVIREQRRGLSVGIPKLDWMTNGWKPGELHILAARPAMGKTALAMGIASHVSIHQQMPVAVISLEMSKESLLERAMCSRARIDMGSFHRGDLGREQQSAANAALTDLCSSPLYIDDKPVQNIPFLLSRLRRLRSEAGGTLGLVVVDYIQLMESPRYDGNRVQEVSAISRGLKLASKELNCPVLALSQLSRECEKRDDKRPRLSDLRDSGSIEQDADTVSFLFREEVYNPQREDLRGMAELILAKHRNGPIGTIDMRFDGQFVRFSPLEENRFAG